MADEWEETTVGDLVKRGVLERPLDGNHGSIHPKGDDFVSSGVPFVMASDLIGGGIDTVNCSFISLEQAKSLRKGFAKRGDVLISHKATLGRTALVGDIPGDFVMLTPQVTYYRAKDATKLNNRYLKYYFDSERFQQVLQSWAGAGSTRAYIGITDQLRLPVLLPPLADQKTIAAVLGALDDQIELSRRMNATLEAMARALFQSWFVDFDPVRTKLDGRHPHGLEPATADLFPPSFQESRLGHIPTGWETGSILRQADLLSGGTPKTDVPAYWNGDVPWASAKDVSQCGEAFLIRTERTITEQGVDESSTKIIPAYATVVVARGATTGRLTMFGHPMAMNQTCYGLRSRIGAPFALYCHARDVIERLVQGGHGSIFDTITTSTFEATDVLLAPKELLLAFDLHVTPLFEQIRANLHRSRTLATLRDTLLPKLLSGELSVRSASAAVDAAA